jgi:hypothetical protein
MARSAYTVTAVIFAGADTLLRSAAKERVGIERRVRRKNKLGIFMVILLICALLKVVVDRFPAFCLRQSVLV